VLVEMGPVEGHQAVLVGREVARHPVQNDADALVVTRLHEVLELGRRAVAAGRREEADRLIAPGPVEGMLGDRQELDVGEAHVLDIRDQLLGKLEVAERPVAVLGHPAPGRQVHLVDRDRGRDPVEGAAAGEESLVAPREAVQVAHHRGGLGPKFRAEAEGVRLQGQPLSGGRLDLVLVARPLAHLGQEDLPDAGGAPAAHTVAAAVPFVEVADHSDPLGTGRPDREVGAGHGFVDHDVGTQALVGAPVGALGPKVLVQLAQHRPEAVGVVQGPGVAPSGAFQAIGE
jgi:hypothetical protein